jgi:hypothetical protein
VNELWRRVEPKYLLAPYRFWASLIPFRFALALCTVVWLVSAPFSMFVHQKVVRNPHNFAEAKKGHFLACD